MRTTIIFAALLAVGCKSSSVNDGYAIDLTLTVDASVSASDLAQASTLDFEVTGAETYSNMALSIAGKFNPTTRSAGLRYRPGARTGTITINASILDGTGMPLAAGELDNVTLRSGTQLLTLTFVHATPGADGGVDLGAGDMGPTCGNGVLDPGEACDPGSGSTMACPTSAGDCDDQNSCTTDSVTGTGCQATCMHTPVADSTGCMTGTASGVCIAGACCTGCLKNGVCKPGSSDPTACGAAGNDCFDCTQNSAMATCSGGSCSGCDATSCTTEGRTCGTSSCGFNCGGCPDGCSNGNLTHYACVNKSCQMNGSGNCGLYAACATSSTCATTCAGDNGCVATAWCGSSMCKSKVGVGSACSAETTGDHECASPYVCSWASSATAGICTSTRCTACLAADAGGGCTALISYGKDPRGACAGYQATACHQNFCSGSSVGETDFGYADYCDFGWDAAFVPRQCGSGTYTCANDGTGMGVKSGPGFCIQGRSCTGTTDNCINEANDVTCFPCNSSHNGCDETAGFFCG
ncbi:MAG TPA: hypothetical protein VGL86_23705 [Polyangia bacterium]|jgi:hypothetical protein